MTILFIILSLLAVILFFNFFKHTSRQTSKSGRRTDISSINGYIERFSKSITYKTISYENRNAIDYSAFLQFHEFIKESFPLLAQTLEVETVNKYSLLFHWKGENKTIKPVILLAHIDVVPVSEHLWSVPPFGGIIKDGYIWGRGTIDNKVNLMGQLEAVEFLLSQGFQPQGDIYLAYGHDEEILGKEGAAQIAQLLKSRNIEPKFVLDEGGFVTNIIVPGVNHPVALIGTSEKGFLDLNLKVRTEGGHSSMPKDDNAITVMSQALSKLMSRPFKPGLTPSTREFLAFIAPHSKFLNRLAFSNLWLFKPLIFRILSKKPRSKAMIHNTMVPTIIHGGEKSNVVPDEVSVTVNYRLLPGTSVDDIISYTQKAINNPLVEIEVSDLKFEPSEASPSDNEPFRKITDAIYKNFENAIVTPFLMVATTDSRYYNTLTPNIYKFSPMIDPGRFHGVDEKLEINVYQKTIGFYVDLIKGL